MLENLNNYFDFIYVLTIPRATERHEHIKRQLKGVNFRFFYGVDKADLDIDTMIKNGEICSNYKGLKERTSNLMGTVACTIGHRMIYEDIVRNGYERVLIFEDDAVMVDARKQFFLDALRHIPTDSDLLLFGYTGGVIENPKYPHFVRRLLHTVKNGTGYYKRFKSTICVPYNRFFDSASEHAGTYCYSVSKRLAEKMVALQTPLAQPADIIFHGIVREKTWNAYITKHACWTDATYFNNGYSFPSLIQG